MRRFLAWWRGPQVSTVELRWERKSEWATRRVIYDSWGLPRVIMPRDIVCILKPDGQARTEYGHEVEWKLVSGPEITFPEVESA